MHCSVGVVKLQVDAKTNLLDIEKEKEKGNTLTIMFLSQFTAARYYVCCDFSTYNNLKRWFSCDQMKSEQ
jgi:hypothetical protein